MIAESRLAERIADQLGVDRKYLSVDHLKGCESLDGSGAGIVSLDGLQLCINLTVLSLQDNRIVDLTPLSKLFDLEVLSLNGNPVVDLSPLKSLKSLRTLFLGKTLVSDLSFVRELPSLREISVVFTNVTSLAELYFCRVLEFTPYLEKVYAFGNSLDDASIVFAAALQNLDVEVML